MVNGLQFVDLKKSLFLQNTHIIKRMQIKFRSDVINVMKEFQSNYVQDLKIPKPKRF